MLSGTGRRASAPLEPGSSGCRSYHEYASTRKAAGRDSRYAKGGHRRFQHHGIPANSCHRTQWVHSGGWGRSPDKTSYARRRGGTKNGDTKTSVVFRLDRLGVPLIEVSTGPIIHDPEQAGKVAFAIGR